MAALAPAPATRTPLLAVDDASGFRMLELQPGVLRVGRGAFADIVLEDPAASRRHARILIRPDHVEVVDDGSLNGTWVNGERVQRAVLQHGDAVRVGRTLMCFVDPERQRLAALAP